MGCEFCARQDPERCPESKRACGHHCNHSWDQDACCYCGTEFGGDGDRRWAAPSGNSYETRADRLVIGIVEPHPARAGFIEHKYAVPIAEVRAALRRVLAEDRADASRITDLACERMECLATMLVSPMTEEEREAAYTQACAWARRDAWGVQESRDDAAGGEE